MNPETNRIEYKQELIDDLEEEVVAFLNYQEGVIIYSQKEMVCEFIKRKLRVRSDSNSFL